MGDAAESFLDECFHAWEHDPHDGFKPTYSPEKRNNYIQFSSLDLPDGERSQFHYEILCNKDGSAEVAVHFETPTHTVNQSRLELLRPFLSTIEHEVRLPCHKFGVIGTTNTSCSFRVPAIPSSAAAANAVDTLKLLIGATWPLLERHLPKDRSIIR